MKPICPYSKRVLPGSGHGKRVHCPSCGRRVVAVHDRLTLHRCHK